MDSKVTKIHKFNIFYLLLKYYQLFVFSLFYKRVETIARNNIPYGSPIIFTPNHQNALMDALVVINTSRLSPVFMARSDIFRKKFQKKMLTLFKMLPIYRMRDGVEELSKNDDTFNTCLEILHDCYSVSLMPEGNHGGHRRLRPLVKGAFRIAFRAQEDFGDKNPVKIVPVGIDYEHYQNIQQNLLIIYGKPIEVSDYIDEYKENPPKAINSLKDRLSDEMKKIIIHIENEEHYDMFQDLRSIYNSRMRIRSGIIGKSLFAQFQADKQMISILDENIISNPEKMNHLSARVAEYMSGLKKLNIRNWVIERKGFSLFHTLVRLLIMAITFPVFLAGWIINIFPYNFTLNSTKKVKDPQFISSFRFVVSMISFLLYYIIISILVRIFTGSALIAWLSIPGVLVLGYFSLYYSFSFKKLRAAIRFRILSGKKDKLLTRISDLHKEIITTMNEISQQHMESLIKTESRGWHEKS